MWKAGDQLIGNIGNVFEISVGPEDVGNYDRISLAKAMKIWLGSSGHRDVVKGTGKWSFLTKDKGWLL